MSITLFLSAVLVGPSISPSAPNWREEFQSVMRASAERSKADPQIIVPRLVHYYQTLETIDGATVAERGRMRKSIEGRLVRQLEELLRDKARHSQKSRAIATRSNVSTPANSPGGGPAFVAQPLIDMIVNTISPETWQQRGGQGTIMYYANNPALVIRQSQRVHEEIGELLQALR